jgi:4-amino-4-deoxy-L-arabinose transferase-like glycosyltransferase
VSAGRLFRSGAVLLAAVLVLRSAGFAFGVLNIDESDFMLFGASLWRGELPYRDLVEIKPPLGYLTYFPAGLLGGLSIYPMRVLGVLWVFATALLLRGAARLWTGDEDAGWAAAWLSLVAGSCEVPSFGSEVMMNLPTAAALRFWAHAQTTTGGRRRVDDALCGTCIGLASLYRHQGAVTGLALGIALLWASRRERGHLLRLALLAACALLPWAAAVGVYAAMGQLHPFVEWTILRNLAYTGQGAAGSALARFAQSTALCVGAAAVPWALAARQSLRSRGDLTGLGFALLLWLTWLPVCMGGRFYEHYYLQFVPPLAVLAAPAAARLARGFHELRRPARSALALGCALPVLSVLGFSYARGLLGGYPAQEPRTVELARWLRARSEPSDRVFVWGHYTPIYTLAQRLPGTRYYNTSVHMGNFDPEHLPRSFDAAAHRSPRDELATLDDLERRRPRWVVDTATADIHGWKRVPLSAFPDLAGFIESHYVEVGRPGGARVLRLRDEAVPTASGDAAAPR